VSNACLALYIPIEADLTSNSGFFVDSEIRPVNVCDSHWLNAVGRYRAILFAPLLAAAGDIDLLPPSTQHELLYVSPALVLLFGYAIICLVVRSVLDSFVPEHEDSQTDKHSELALRSSRRLRPHWVRSAFERGRMGKSLTMRPREYLIASGGAALPNGWNLLFGEAIRRNCAPGGAGSQLDSLRNKAQPVIAPSTLTVRHSVDLPQQRT